MTLATRILRLAVIGLLTPVVMLLGCQSRLIYYPNVYHQGYWDALDKYHGQKVEYETSQGQQVAYYVPPRNGETTPRKLWLCFGGNGSLALDWLLYIDRWDPGFGYLLIDYPSYGACEGSPTPARIRESSLAALKAARAKHLPAGAGRQSQLAVLGHSIGCAAGLMAADDLNVKQVVLISPFTTLTEMGRRVIGWPLCYLNMHTFDNRREINRICSKGAKVTLFHGTSDEIIPVSMSRELVAESPGSVVLHEIEHQDHNSIIARSSRVIGEAMSEAVP